MKPRGFCPSMKSPGKQNLYPKRSQRPYKMNPYKTNGLNNDH